VLMRDRPVSIDYCWRDSCTPSSGKSPPDQTLTVECQRDEIATAIARCAGCLADSVATGESINSGEGKAIHYGGSSQIFFDR
jgi:hypothetical protein